MIEQLLWMVPLVVVAAGLWVMRGRSPQRSSAVPPYVRALNYLYEDRPDADAAIQALADVEQTDAELVEIYLLLGREFRRRGEIERAISAHQNLIARPDLSSVQRERGLLELGDDFQGIGWLDRAERLFVELLDSEQFQAEALGRLTQIYEREKEWGKAIEAAERLQTETGRDHSTAIAHYYCELAEEARQRGDLGRAMRRAKAALQSSDRSVRASLLLGHLYMEYGQHGRAIRALRRIESQDPALLPEAVGPMLACYRRQGEFQGALTVLERWNQQSGSARIIAARASLLREAGRPAEARQVLDSAIATHPSLELLQEMVRLAEPADVSPGFGAGLAEALASLQAEHGHYVCRRCGFETRKLYWRCPGCRSWSTIKPV